jgi:hypothetical protein
MKKMAEAEPVTQREISTRLFIGANGGVVTMQDVIPNSV